MAKPDLFLTVTVRNLPAEFVFDSSGALRPKIAHYAAQGVVRKIIAGATACHVEIDIKRPYFRPFQSPALEEGEGRTIPTNISHGEEV